MENSSNEPMRLKEIEMSNTSIVLIQISALHEILLRFILIELMIGEWQIIRKL